MSVLLAFGITQTVLHSVSGGGTGELSRLDKVIVNVSEVDGALAVGNGVAEG